MFVKRFLLTVVVGRNSGSWYAWDGSGGGERDAPAPEDMEEQGPRREA